MRGGDDLVSARSRDVGTFLGGSGRDELAVFGKKTSSRTTSFFADMARSRYGFNGQKTATFRSFEDLTVRDVKDAVVKGDGRRNQIFVTGCNNTVFARVAATSSLALSSAPVRTIATGPTPSTGWGATTRCSAPPGEMS